MFMEICPDLLGFLFNPPETTSDWIKHWLKPIRVFHHLKRGKYRFYLWRFLKMAGMSQE
jgi:hypothetical protein